MERSFFCSVRSGKSIFVSPWACFWVLSPNIDPWALNIVGLFWMVRVKRMAHQISDKLIYSTLDYYLEFIEAMQDKLIKWVGWSWMRFLHCVMDDNLF